MLPNLNVVDYVDRFLGGLRKLIKDKLDPMYLEPSETTFEYSLLFMNFTSQLFLTDTTVHGLPYVQRSGLPVVKYRDKNVNLSWRMIFPRVEMRSSYALNIFNTSRNGRVKASVSDVLADVEFKYDLHTVKMSMEDIKLRTKGDINVELGQEDDKVDRVSSILVKTVANIFKKDILESVEEAIKESVEETLAGFRVTD